MSGMEILFTNMLKALKIDPNEMKAKFQELVDFARSIDNRLARLEEQQQHIMVQNGAVIAFIGELAKHGAAAADGSVPATPALPHFNGGGNGAVITTPAEQEKGSLSDG